MHHRLALVLCVLATACSGGGDSTEDLGLPTLHIDVTDSPFHDGKVEAAILHVDRITMHVQADATSGFIEVYQGAPIEIDLIELRNGITRRMTSRRLPPGTYRQLRLHVSHALLRLENGVEYSTEEGGLQMTSQDTSGFKVFLDPPIELVEGLSDDRVLLDFDLVRTFKAVGKPDDPLKFHLHPGIRAATSTMTAEIHGVVSVVDLSGSLLPAPDAVIYLLPPGERDLDQSITTTLSEVDGSMALIGLPGGTYDLVAVLGDEQVRVNGVPVVADEIAVVDLTIP